jgi:hypothetical protein
MPRCTNAEEFNDRINVEKLISGIVKPPGVFLFSVIWPSL